MNVERGTLQTSICKSNTSNTTLAGNKCKVGFGKSKIITTIQNKKMVAQWMSIFKSSIYKIKTLRYSGW